MLSRRSRLTNGEEVIVDRGVNADVTTNTPMFDLIKTLTEIPGPTGQEDLVHNWCADHWSTFAEETEITRVGNVVAKVGGHGPAIVILAHGDELGLMVKSVTENGLLHIWPVARDLRGRPSYSYSPVNQPVIVMADNGHVDGQLVYASGHVIGGGTQKDHFEWNDWFVDLGYSVEAGCRITRYPSGNANRAESTNATTR